MASNTSENLQVSLHLKFQLEDWWIQVYRDSTITKKVNYGQYRYQAAYKLDSQ